MKRLVLAASTALLWMAILVGPAAAFPEQGDPQSCDVRQMKILGTVPTLFDTSWRRLLRKPRRRPGW
jgi:hypothetical protein